MNSAKKPDNPSFDLLARQCALDIFTTVFDKKNALDVLLDTSKVFASFDQRDRAFIRMLVSTCLRHLGQIDDLIRFAQDRPDSLKTPMLRNILRLGVTQIFFMDVPDHASVDTSVRLAEQAKLGKQKNFVNAVLRKILRDGKERFEKQDPARLNTPDWLLQIWIADYGLNAAAQIANAHMGEAALDITVKDAAQRAEWASALDATLLPTGSLRRNAKGGVKALDGFDAGEWWVQDAAAALPATLFGDLSGAHVADMCAAPGGKTMQLVALGANVTALDRSVKRMKRVEENLKRVGFSDRVKIEIADASVWKPAEPVTHILLDAPCSATGTIRRHPDNVYLKTPQDIARLCTIQERLLYHAADILAEGGMMIYCTCSLQKDEGERQIEKFLSTHRNFERLVVIPQDVGGCVEFINDDGDIRILPFMLSDQGGIDGFFVSRLRKIKND